MTELSSFAGHDDEEESDRVPLGWTGLDVCTTKDA
jgi:hypothetical protein